MKRFLVCLLMVLGVQLYAADLLPFNPTINWSTNYKEALKESKETKKPMVIFFTGSDWCTWCKKLESESLNTTDFVNAMDGKVIFVKADFPRTGNTNPAASEQNEKLRVKYKIHGYPTLLVLDSDEKELGELGYLPGGGSNYATELLKIVNKQ